MKAFHRPIIYLTLGDSPNGIFKTQVVDVVNLYRKNTLSKVHLVSFISIRGFLKSRRKIKSWHPDAWVFPMYPKLKNWKSNSLILKLFLVLFGNKAILIGRGIFATNLLLANKSKNHKVVYDGRGAIWAEAKEFKVYKNAVSDHEIFQLEKNAIFRSNYRIAVSNKLVKYWEENYEYSLSEHVIIPCSFTSTIPSNEISRSDLGWDDQDVIFVYSGSNDAWQGLNKAETFLECILNRSSKNKILILAQSDKILGELKTKYPKQFVQTWLKPELVRLYLDIADYGILIRPISVTNKVASPVKFSEYLASGLQVLISDGVGDFSEFVVNNKIGYLINNFRDFELFDWICNSKKKEIIELSKISFCKEEKVIRDKYLSLITI